jgi:hypothetical protein
VTIQVQPARSDAAGYWRSRIQQIAVEAGAVAPADTLLYSTDTRATARETLLRGAVGAGYEVEEYPAHKYTVFIPGKLALIYDDAARWMAICTVSSLGRLVAVNDVAVWGEGW